MPKSLFLLLTAILLSASLSLTGCGTAAYHTRRLIDGLKDVPQMLIPGSSSSGSMRVGQADPNSPDEPEAPKTADPEAGASLAHAAPSDVDA